MTAAEVRADPVDLARRLAGSDRLRRRRFEVLPLRGPGACFTDVQGRAPSTSTTPAHLSDLISSISTVGLLQPVLVEELPDGRRRVVAGERRLRAATWGAAHLADNEHFDGLPAVVCPGPLSEEERRVWQLVENLAREDLRPGELAAALLYDRCALLTARLLHAGVAVPAEVAALDDPVGRFRALDRLRTAAGRHHLGAPWADVLRRLGLHLREERAKQLARAFACLPPELSAEMDARRISLATRIDYLKLDRGCAGAAAAIWDAVAAVGRFDLLPAAVRAKLEHAELAPEDAVARADELHRAADDARCRGGAIRHAGDADHRADTVIDALRLLCRGLRDGETVSTFRAGSLRLYAGELMTLLEEAAA